LFVVLLLTLPDVAGLVLDAALELQPGANGRRRFGCPRLDRRIVGIVAMRTVVQRAFVLPIGDALSMGSEIPVLVAVRMAPPADEVCLIKIYGFAEQGVKVIALLEIVTRQAPDSAAPVLELHLVRRSQFAYLRVGFHGRMAYRARIEEQLILAWNYGEVLRARVSLES